MYKTIRLKNDRLIRALRRQKTDRVPVWLMRQAGRYLPEYRAVRATAGDFLTLCKTPELACEVTLQPLARFDLDAAIIFSDILTIPDAMGLGLSIDEGRGPRFSSPIRSPSEIHALPKLDIQTDLDYVLAAIKLVHRELAGRVPLIGFSGSPWTLAAYMVEGRSSRDFLRAKKMLYDDAKSAKLLLAKLGAAITDYLTAQIQAGAQVLMIFDTWGGLLSSDNYVEFSLKFIGEIVGKLKSSHPHIPLIVFTKGGGNWLELIADTGCDAVGLDWTVPPAQARQRIGGRVALQGNLDPAILQANTATIERAAVHNLRQFGAAPGHIFNLGHGIKPTTNPDKVKCLVDAVHNINW